MIHILSHFEAWAKVRRKPNFYAVVYVGDPGRVFYNDSREILRKAKTSIVLAFDDTEAGDRKSTHGMVTELLKFVQKKDDILICSPAGLSRAPAVGYVVGTERLFGAEPALKLLDIERHLPNFLFVQQAAEVMKKADMIGYIRRFRESALSICR